MFCYSDYTTNKVTRKDVSGLCTTLGDTLLTCSSKTRRTITFISMEEYCVALLACAQEVNFVNVSLKYINELWKPAVVYEDNQGAIFLANNRQVGMRTKHINICHHFMGGVVEDKDMDINYIIRK